MGRRSKQHKPSTRLVREILAVNVVALRDRKYAGLKNETAKNKKLAGDSHTTLSQIQRIIGCRIGPSIDTLFHLAQALQVLPHQLLTPYFLDPTGQTESPDQVELQQLRRQ